MVDVYDIMLAAIQTYYGTQANTNEFIIKLGKGSGSIFTSLNPHQPQTRTVFGGLPMGWCKVSYEEES